MNHQHIVHRINLKRENEAIEAMERNYKPAMLLFIFLAVYVIGSMA